MSKRRFFLRAGSDHDSYSNSDTPCYHYTGRRGAFWVSMDESDALIFEIEEEANRIANLFNRYWSNQGLVFRVIFREGE